MIIMLIYICIQWVAQHPVRSILQQPLVKKNTPMIADIALNAQIKLAKIPMISPIPG